MIIETIKLNEMGMFPEFFLGIGIIYLLLHGLLVSFNIKNRFPLIQSSIVSLSVLCLIMVCILLSDSINCISFCNTITNDYLSFITKIIIGLVSIGCLLLIQQYLSIQRINSFEYMIIILFAILGLFLLCCANDLITAYLAIELQSLSFYVLAAFKKDSTHSIESGLKYFILGAFSSGLFLFGSSFIYGASGSVNFSDLKDLALLGENSLILQELNVSRYDNLTLIGVTFIYIGMFFKLAVAPFHIWSPDVYEGSPTSSTLFFAIVPKISIFILLTRLSYYTFPTFIGICQEYITIIAIASIIIGSVAGLEQRKFKSLLAYSSISHMGYILISFSLGSVEGFQVLFCYLIIYVGSGLCIWSIFILTRLKLIYNKKQNKDLSNLTLLCKSNNMLALVLMVALFSIAGLPPMIGFIVKLGIFLAAIEQSMYIVVLVSIIFSVISTFIYLRIVKVLFFESVLVGNLYYSIKSQKALIGAIFAYLFIFLFINPSILYLACQKISLLFCNSTFLAQLDRATAF